MKIFIIHGSFGSPSGNWFPWLEKNLKNLGHEVYVPKFPIEDYDSFSKALKKDPTLKPQNQNLENWMNTFQKYVPKIDEETIFIGHSLGPAFILNVLEKINVKVRACILVSAFLGRIGIPEFDAVNDSFYNKKFEWWKIKRNCNEFFVVSSDDDPYVPFKLTKDFRKNLEREENTKKTTISQNTKCKFKLIKNGKHLNLEAGYNKFDYLLKLIQKLSGNNRESMKTVGFQI